ncbi:hypothetical protein EGW08_009012, partial [Elysia chlorotica]
SPLPPTVPTTSAGWSRPASALIIAGADLRRPDMPKIDEDSEMERPSSSPAITSESTAVPSVVPTPAPSSSAVTAATAAEGAATSQPGSSTAPPSTSSLGAVPPATLVAKPSLTLTRVLDSLTDLPTDSNTQKSSGRFVVPPSSSSAGRDLVSRSISVPARLPTQKDHPSSTSTTTTTTTTRASTSVSLTGSEGELPVPLWRQGLRKTGSSSMVHEWMSHNDSNALPRSASSPRLALDSRLDTLQERLAARRPMSSIGSTPSSSTATATTTTATTPIGNSNDSDSTKSGDRNSYTFGQSFAGYRSSYAGRPGGYVPLHLRQQQREAEDREKSQALPGARDRSTYCGPSSVSSPASSSSPSTTNSVFKRSFEPPKRDEETETQRKARAKHARQTRRSTQGVSLEDVTKATEEIYGSEDPSKVSRDSVDGQSSSSRNSHLDRDSSSGLGRSASSVGAPSATCSSSLTTASTTSSTSSTTASSVSSSDVDLLGQREDRSITSGYRLRRALEDRNDSSNMDVPTTRSYRRTREERDLNSLSQGLGSSDVTSSYVPRSQRNSAILLGDSGSSSSQNLLRSSSLRAGRLRNGDTSDFSSTPTPRPEEDSKRDDSSQEKKDEKKEPSAIRARRQRRERRSTGITYDNEDSETSKENKPEEEKKEDNLGSSRFSSRYGSNSDASDRSQRPMSYSEYSRSTGSLLDYKKVSRVVRLQESESGC